MEPGVGHSLAGAPGEIELVVHSFVVRLTKPLWLLQTPTRNGRSPPDRSNETEEPAEIQPRLVEIERGSFGRRIRAGHPSRSRAEHGRSNPRGARTRRPGRGRGGWRQYLS